MIKSRNTLVLIALGIVVLGAAVYMLFLRDSGESAVTAVEGPASSAEFTFITLASQIDPIVFDTAVIADPRFMSLQDIRTAVIPEPSGKQDPFAPLQGVAPATQPTR